MVYAAGVRWAFVLVACVACKSKPAPVAVVDAAPASAEAHDAALVVDAGLDATRAFRPPPSIRSNSVDAVAVSSRVENGTETPGALVDGDLDTAWSSRTGDLVGAWVALRLFNHSDVLSAVELTVGMTKDADLFQQNVRIAEVRVSFAPILDDRTHALGPDVVLADHVKLDTESRDLQSIPVTAKAPGVVKITIQAIKAGSKASWREATISEIKLDDAKGPLGVSPAEIDVGSFDPKPRGVLGLVPERRVPLGCLAALPGVPRAYCILGSWGSTGRAAALVTVDKDGVQSIASLTGPTPIDPQLPYDAWLRAERELRGGTTLGSIDSKDKPADVTLVPWGGSVDVEGVTFRQRETQHQTDGEGPSTFNGVLEVRFGASSTFTKIFDETFPAATASMVAAVRPIGSMWLVERRMTHGSEGWYVSDARAVMCDLRGKRCGTFAMPASSEPER